MLSVGLPSTATIMSPGRIPRAVSWRPSKRCNHDHFIVARTNRHAHAVVLAALIFAQQRIRLRIKEIRVRIEHMQHARNGPVVNRLVGIHRLGIILLDQAVDVGKLAQAVTYIGIAARRCCRVDLLTEDHAKESAGDENKDR